MSATITKVHLFIEIPWLEEGMTVVGLNVPFEFIEFADQELSLNGALKTYVKSRADSIKVEQINRLDGDERKSFYSERSSSTTWKTYFRSTEAGYRYSILVEFDAESAVAELAAKILAQESSIGLDLDFADRSKPQDTSAPTANSNLNSEDNQVEIGGGKSKKKWWQFWKTKATKNSDNSQHEVRFLKKREEGVLTYYDFESDTEEQAIAYLLTKIVDQRFLYYHVYTPQSLIGKDQVGFFRQERIGDGWGEVQALEIGKREHKPIETNRTKDYSGKIKRCIRCSGELPEVALRCPSCGSDRFIWE